MAKILTPHFVTAFPSVFKATSYMDSEPKFSLTAIFHPKNFNPAEKKSWAKLTKGIDEVTLATFKKKANMLPKNFKLGLRDGAEKPDLNGFSEDCIFANFTSKYRPDIVDIHGEPVEEEEGRIYAGCIMRASVTPYAYNNVGKGYALGLNNIQLLKWDTPRIDGRTSASEDFASEEEEYDNLSNLYGGEDEAAPSEADTAAASEDEADEDIPF